MRKSFDMPRPLVLGLICFTLFGLLAPQLAGQDAAPTITKETIANLDKALNEAKVASSEARQRVTVNRIIREAENLVSAHANDTSRFLALEFLFRARQRLISIDKDPENRKALMVTCRELLKAPDEMAGLRLDADLLITQVEQAKQGASPEARTKALRPLVERYLNTPVATKVLRMAIVMALELGDNRLVADLQGIIEKRFGSNLEMINFQRDKLGGQVIGAPFVGIFERSDGKKVRFPMDFLGRTAMLIFWSKENGGDSLLKGFATAAAGNKDIAERIQFVSFNLDDLPDAGESIVRGLGVDWPVFRLPGGRKNPIYETYVRADPWFMTMTPTGYTALTMMGSTKPKGDTAANYDFGRMFGPALARSWTFPSYYTQLSSLFAGDFLVFDTEGAFNPSLPPELKAAAEGGKPQPLARGASSVPEETLRAIQSTFVAPPMRYRLSHAEARANYAKAAELCRKAIKDHAGAPDLWIVRNRLIIALMGLWKADADLGKLDEAAAEAKAATAAGYPPGCDVIARFCLARAALRDPAADPREVITKLVADNGGDKAPGTVLSVAALLALDVADRTGFEEYRKAILKSHIEHPMMWTFTTFLLDRHHSYWLFQVPFVAGWSYARREDYFKSKGDTEQTNRILHTELSTAEGKPLRIPEDIDSNFTVIVFAKSAPWSSKHDDGLPPSPKGIVKSFNAFAASRPEGDVKVLLALLGGEVGPARAEMEDPKYPYGKVDCPIFTVPGGIDNPLVRRLGIVSEDKEINCVLVDKNGRIALMYSGLSNQGGTAIPSAIMFEDEKAVSAALERGEIEAAKEKIFKLAPPYDPNAVDAKGHKPPKPNYSTSHLLARARVYMALKEWDKALADAEEVVQRHTDTGGGLSLRIDELDASEQLRDKILELGAKLKK